MALFDNVTFDFYKDTLGRSEVPDEAAFNKFALQEKLFVKSLIDDGVIEEQDENGFDSAVCMMIEEDYKNSLVMSGETAPVLSESIGGYSRSRSGRAYDAAVEKNSLSLAERKYLWLHLYCYVNAGVM